MSGKYKALTAHLEANKLSELIMTFGQIEEVIGSPLPPFASQRRFWANTESLSYPQRSAIAAAGWKAFLISGTDKVRFKRD